MVMIPLHYHFSFEIQFSIIQNLWFRQQWQAILTQMQHNSPKTIAPPSCFTDGVKLFALYYFHQPQRLTFTTKRSIMVSFFYNFPPPIAFWLVHVIFSKL